MSKKSVDRRSFLATGAAAGAAMTLPAASYARVAGANEALRIGFLGVGGRCQQHVDVILQMQKEDKSVAPVAVNDVWDGDPELGNRKGRGLYPTAKRCGINADDKNHVTKDYRKILDQKDVDLVCIATPDHWHARMAIDAMQAGKDVYMEKPMTRTIAEAIAVVDAAQKLNRVVTVGVQSMADPTWRAAHEYITAGKIGKVLQGQTSYYRNSSVGQWRYYPLKKDMTPKTIDWNMWLGHQFKGVDGEPIGPTPEQQPFDRAVWAQWRCYWPFGGGMFTDLFVHQTTHLIAAMGVRFPGRVVGAGGIYMEYDGRDVPDVATVVADYEEGCQFIVSATMVNDVQLGEMIRGHLGTIKFTGGGDYMGGFEVYGQYFSGGPSKPKGAANDAPVHTYKNEKAEEARKAGHNATYALWENFLDCVRSKKRETLSTPELGAAAFSTVNMGVLSYRFGKVLMWDKEKRAPRDASDLPQATVGTTSSPWQRVVLLGGEVIHKLHDRQGRLVGVWKEDGWHPAFAGGWTVEATGEPPVSPPSSADSQGGSGSWAARWEARSKKRGKPNHVMGWKAGDTGSLLTPPDYQKLEGPWVNGQDPAAQ